MGESPKVEARLGIVMQTALGLYMKDRHLQNESEVLRSALGKFLNEEGYLEKAKRILVRVAEHGETYGGKRAQPEKPKTKSRVKRKK